MSTSIDNNGDDDDNAFLHYVGQAKQLSLGKGRSWLTDDDGVDEKEERQSSNTIQECDIGCTIFSGNRYKEQFAKLEALSKQKLENQQHHDTSSSSKENEFEDNNKGRRGEKQDQEPSATVPSFDKPQQVTRGHSARSLHKYKDTLQKGAALSTNEEWIRPSTSEVKEGRRLEETAPKKHKRGYSSRSFCAGKENTISSRLEQIAKANRDFALSMLAANVNSESSPVKSNKEDERKNTSRAGSEDEAFEAYGTGKASADGVVDRQMESDAPEKDILEYSNIKKKHRRGYSGRSLCVSKQAQRKESVTKANTEFALSVAVAAKDKQPHPDPVTEDPSVRFCDSVVGGDEGNKGDTLEAKIADGDQISSTISDFLPDSTGDVLQQDKDIRKKTHKRGYSGRSLCVNSQALRKESITKANEDFALSVAATNDEDRQQHSKLPLLSHSTETSTKEKDHTKHESCDSVTFDDNVEFITITPTGGEQPKPNMAEAPKQEQDNENSQKTKTKKRHRHGFSGRFLWLQKQQQQQQQGQNNFN